MNVLIVPSWYPTEYNKVRGSFFKEQAEALAKKCNVVVVSINTVGIRDLVKYFTALDLFKLKYTIENGIKTYSINIFGFGLTKTRLFYDIYILLLKSIIRNNIIDSFMPDIIHAHSYKYAGYACTKIFDDIPVVVTEHSSAVGLKLTNNVDIKKLNYTINNAKRFICVSNYLREKLIDVTKTKKKIYVIHNMVSYAFNYNGKRHRTNNKFVFCTVSNLVPVKQVDILIQSFNKCFHNNNNVYLKIAGDGIEKGKLEVLINDLEMSQQILLLGQLDRRAILELYRESNVFIMVSASETFGLVYAESLMCGLPTIGTINGGANDILNCYGGYLCKVNDINDITRTLKKAYLEYDTFDQNRISIEAKRRFAEDVIIDQILNLYCEVVK